MTMTTTTTTMTMMMTTMMMTTLSTLMTTSTSIYGNKERISVIFASCDLRTYGRTYGWTDGQTDKVAYRDARTHLKRFVKDHNVVRRTN